MSAPVSKSARACGVPDRGPEPAPGTVQHSTHAALRSTMEHLRPASPSGKEAQGVEIWQTGEARLGAFLGPVLDFLAQVVFLTMLVIFVLARHEDLRDRLIR